ncbi:MAG: DMT family transporter, partial [Phycisphaerales bacterium]
MMIYFKQLLTAMLWGGAFVAGRYVSQHAGPFSIAFLRFAIASALLIGLAWKIEGRLAKPKRGQITSIILLGITGVFLYNSLFFTALKTVEASRASLIIATCPVFIALSSAVLLKERLSLAKVLGVVLSVSGAMVVISRASLRNVLEGGMGRGELYLFGCVASWAAYSLIGRSVMNKLSPLICVSYASVVGAVALCVPACIEGLWQNLRSQSLLDWLCILYLAVFATAIGFVWYYQGVKHIGPTRAGLFINFVPIFAILFAFIFLREAITISLLVGAALVVGGVYLTNRPS